MKIGIPYDPAIPLLGTFLIEMHAYGQARLVMPVIPVLWEAEAGESFELGRQRLQ